MKTINYKKLEGRGALALLQKEDGSLFFRVRITGCTMDFKIKTFINFKSFCAFFEEDLLPPQVVIYEGA